MSINILNCGLGDAGCRLTNTSKELFTNTDCIFINTNVNGTSSLKHSNINNTVYLETLSGAAKNRNTSKEAFKKSEDKILMFLNDKVNNYSIINLFASVDGGTGSGIVLDVVKTIREINEDIKVNLIAVCPDISSSKMIPLKNTISFYSDFVYIQKNNLINGYMFIDNQKIGNGTMEEFNERIIDDLLSSYEIAYNDLDESDIIEIMSKNYVVTLRLNDTLNVENAIKAAIMTSPFLIENGYIGTHIGISVDVNSFDPIEVSSKFNIRDFEKITTNDFEENRVLLSGAKMPVSYFKNVEKKISELNQIVDNNFEMDYFQPTTNFDKDKLDEKQVIEKKKPMSKMELRKKLRGKLR